MPDGFIHANRLDDLVAAWQGVRLDRLQVRPSSARGNSVLIGLQDQFRNQVTVLAPARVVRCPHKKAVTVFDGHHVLQQAEGGPDCPDNVWAICPNCHRNAHTLYRLYDKRNEVPSRSELYGSPLNQNIVRFMAARRWATKHHGGDPCAA